MTCLYCNLSAKINWAEFNKYRNLIWFKTVAKTNYLLSEFSAEQKPNLIKRTSDAKELLVVLGDVQITCTVKLKKTISQVDRPVR